MSKQPKKTKENIEVRKTFAAMDKSENKEKAHNPHTFTLVPDETNNGSSKCSHRFHDKFWIVLSRSRTSFNLPCLMGKTTGYFAYWMPLPPRPGGALQNPSKCSFVWFGASIYNSSQKHGTSIIDSISLGRMYKTLVTRQQVPNKNMKSFLYKCSF